MEFQRVVAGRRMVRAFGEQPISSETVQRILGNAARAPSAGFAQGWEFLVLAEPGDRADFWLAAWPVQEQRSLRREGLVKAPLVIVPCADKQAYVDRYAEQDKKASLDPDRWPVPYWVVDTAFASMLILLTAVDEDLGALFFLLEHEQDVRARFGIPERVTPIGAIAVGVPERDEPSPSLRRGRRSSSDYLHLGSW